MKKLIFLMAAIFAGTVLLSSTCPVGPEEIIIVKISDTENYEFSWDGPPVSSVRVLKDYSQDILKPQRLIWGIKSEDDNITSPVTYGSLPPSTEHYNPAFLDSSFYMEKLDTKESYFLIIMRRSPDSIGRLDFTITQ